MEDVAADGSPVEVYLSLPAEPDLSRVRAVVPAGSSVLDLGSGVGRIANPLTAIGHRVVAVDNSAEMLAHVVAAQRVRADVWTLDLGRRFGAVLALSHLINKRSRSHRVELLRVCRRHVDRRGVVVIQRYPPGWEPAEGSSEIGPVGVRLHDIVSLDDGFAASATYAVGNRSWTQTFDATIVEDHELESLAAEADLEVVGAIDGDAAWIQLGSRPE